MKISTQEQLRQFVADALPEIMRENPQAVVSAIAGDEGGMRAALEQLGFSVRERSVGTGVVEEQYREAIRFGVIDNGLGAHIRQRCETRKVAGPDGVIRHSYLFGEIEEKAEAWMRAFFFSPDKIDTKTGKSARQLHAELESHVRAPSNPFSEANGGAALIPTVIAAEIYALANERFVLKGLVQTFVSAAPLRIPRQTQTVTVSRGATSTDLTETRPATEYISLSVNRVGAIAYIDPKLAAAASVGPVRYILGLLAEAIAKDDQQMIVAGSGASYQPQGLTALPTADANPLNNIKAVDYVETSVLTERASMRQALYTLGQAYREAAGFVWITNSDGILELTSHNDANVAPFKDETYLGKKIVETTAITTDANGGGAGVPATTILGGDLRNYAWVEDPAGLRLEQTTVGGEAWVSDTVGVKCVQHVDGKAILPPAFVRVNTVNI